MLAPTGTCPASISSPRRPSRTRTGWLPRTRTTGCTSLRPATTSSRSCFASKAYKADVLEGWGRPEPAELVEGAHGFMEKEREKVPGDRRVGLLVFRLAQPVEDGRTEPDLLVNGQRGWPLSEAGMGLL